VQSRGFQNDGAVVQPNQNAVEPSGFQLRRPRAGLGQRGVRHAVDGVGGMLGLAPNGPDTLDAVRLDEAGRRRTGGFWRSTQQQGSDLFDRCVEP
jgi:hypothetical protein